MFRRALEVLKGCQTMFGVSGNAKRKLDKIGKDIRHWVKSSKKKP